MYKPENLLYTGETDMGAYPKFTMSFSIGPSNKERIEAFELFLNCIKELLKQKNYWKAHRRITMIFIL